ncbi:heme exporter protein CcmD [Marinobacter sp. SS21]|uniref:heme exporter protein CcmD n=1 Tax=Marinobacter sp. SS21 TaxID=2979460 RepID=UPI00232C1E87|nr:heme exporter protein CcmD [Marinobacter sp. SS21]MDC0662132.1 heme exporter protein CcmD [Marinobacter sp. SS21]
MAFDSLSAFLTMEGHGSYVWVCYCVFVLLLTALALWSRSRRHAVLREQRRLLELEESGTREQAPAAATFSRIHPS